MENLFYKFGAEQICGKPKGYVEFLQTIWLSDLFSIIKVSMTFIIEKDTLHTDLFYKFGAEQICGKPKSYVKFLQTIWLSDLFLNRKNLIFLLKIKFYFHFELRNLKFHIVSYSIKKIFKYSKFILMLSCIFILSCASNKIRGCDGNAQTYELRVMSET